MTDDRIRVAIVGLGTIARAVYLPILSRRNDRFEVVGVCDLSPAAVDAVGDRFGIPRKRRFFALSEMLTVVSADALAVLTSGSHTPAVLAGLDAGLAVLCEKPLAVTQREADLLAAATAGRTDRLMLAYMKLYDPAVLRAVDLVAQRPAVRAVEVTVLHPSGDSQLATSELGLGRFGVDPQQVRELRAAAHALEHEALGEAAGSLGPVYSNVLLGSIVHELAVLRAIGAQVDTVEHADRWPQHVVPASVSFAGRVDGDARVTVGWHYLHDYPTYREQIRRHDERGSIELEFPSPYLLRAPTVLREVVPDGAGAADRRFESRVESFEEQLLAFHRMVTDGTAPAAGVAHGRADIVTCQRIAARLAEREGLQLGGEAAAIDT